MAWKAKLMSIREYEFPSDAVEVTVRFWEEVSGREVDRELKFGLEQLQTPAQFRAAIMSELTRLNTRQSVVTQLKTQLGSEIT